jgi:hypothetical protein
MQQLFSTRSLSDVSWGKVRSLAEWCNAPGKAWMHKHEVCDSGNIALAAQVFYWDQTCYGRMYEKAEILVDKMEHFLDLCCNCGGPRWFTIPLDVLLKKLRKMKIFTRTFCFKVQIIHTCRPAASGSVRWQYWPPKAQPGTPDFLFYIRDPHVPDKNMMELVS